MEFEIQLDGHDPRRALVTRTEHGGVLWLDGKRHDVTLNPVGDAVEITLDGRTELVWSSVQKETVHLHAFGRSWRLEVLDPAEANRQAKDHEDVASAPMPGTVVRVLVAADQSVHHGEILLVIESMKMQTEIVAWRDGYVERVNVEVGETFDRGAELLRFAPLEGESPS